MKDVPSRSSKQAVKRNIVRFSDAFMFELTKEENQSLRSQNVTLKRGQHSKYLLFAFTEQGVAMLSSALRNIRSYYCSLNSKYQINKIVNILC
ncbi:MAG: ORF6N domain-containing protein [Desulfobacterales bacterium]